MIKIDYQLSPHRLQPKLARLWDLSARKIRAIHKNYDPAQGSPVFTIKGAYTSRGWTEWTQGFEVGAAILQFDATNERQFLELGRARTVAVMAPHVTHFGVHDHGFNNVSTYGNLLRLLAEGRIPDNKWERNFYELALKCSGATQARRWTRTRDGGGYIYSFNGPHSLFVDTVRSLRALAIAHRLGHVLMEENDRQVSLLERLVQHARATATWSVYYGKGRDASDTRGRVAHESIFNVNDGNYRCPNSQQGFSPFTTWTRGLAWAMCGFAEQLEFLATCTDEELDDCGGRRAIETVCRHAAAATCDFYLANTPTDGIPYWDTGAPRLHDLGDYLNRPADPFNEFEPVDSSAAAIAAQGLLRLGHYLGSPKSKVQSPKSKVQGPKSKVQGPRSSESRRGTAESSLRTLDFGPGTLDSGRRYWQAGLTVLNTLFDEPYLSTAANHQGLILHSVYHRPNGWDYIPPNRKVPCGESSMWGDYHAREAALYVQRIAENKPYLTFWG